MQLKEFANLYFQLMDLKEKVKEPLEKKMEMMDEKSDMAEEKAKKAMYKKVQKEVIKKAKGK